MAKEAIFEKLSCPACAGGLRRQDELVVCTGCDRTYPVVNGIPRFVERDNYASSFGLQWNIHSKTQLDSQIGLDISRERLFAASQWPERLEGETILEAGSGAGRFTEVLATTGATVLSFDLSSAVEANQASNGDKENVLIVQARIEAAPVAPASMDKVICLGVVQHTPDPHAAFQALAKYVRPGGALVIDCYPKTLRGMLQWKYVLRPVTKRMNEERLYRFVRWYAPKLVPVSIGLTKVLGRWAKRLVPIQQYEDLFPLTKEQNVEWAVLDTFDALSPAHDHPQTQATVQKWFEEAGFRDIVVEHGWNGIVGRGIKA